MRVAILFLFLSVTAHAVEHKSFKRKFPQSHKHKTVNRCLDQKGKWIKGCQ